MNPWVVFSAVFFLSFILTRDILRERKKRRRMRCPR